MALASLPWLKRPESGGEPDRPKEPLHRWVCGGCGEFHRHESSAERCCAPDVEEVWLCPVCEKEHDEKEDAFTCCQVEPVTCPRCLREFKGKLPDAVAVVVAGHCSVCDPQFTTEERFAIDDELGKLES